MPISRILHALLPTLVACSAPDLPPPIPPDQVGVPAAPAVVTENELQRLRWIEGDWWGIEPNGEKFFEGYHFRDDSTMVTLTYADSTYGKLAGSGTIELRRNILTSRGGELAWTATVVSAKEVRFDPIGKANNSFTWVRQDADHWLATLYWKNENGVVEQRNFRMTRRGSK